jgi:PAS domain S-box-containing protein
MIEGELSEVFSILRLSPNGLVLVDDEARIEFVNAAFRRMFSIGEEELTARHAAEFLGVDCFEQAIRSGTQLNVRGNDPQRRVYYRAAIFRIEGERRWCGIFIDTTEEEHARAALVELKRETLARAEEVMRRQMRTAQEIAGLLGETTAETKVLLAKLMDLFRREGSP